MTIQSPEILPEEIWIDLESDPLYYSVDHIDGSQTKYIRSDLCTRATPSSSVTMKREEVEKVKTAIEKSIKMFPSDKFFKNASMTHRACDEALSILSDALENGGKK